MRHENYKSDIALEVTLTLGGVEIPVPEHDFALIFYTSSKKKYTCVHKGDSWGNCKVVGGRLHCYLDNHGLPPGELQVEYYDFIPDTDFADGDQLKVVPRALDLELIYGAGDDATLISVEVATDVASAIARANAISADLEAKRDADYWRGVGIESVEQTTTSTESGGENVVTITLTDGEQSSFSVRNGGSELANYYNKSQTNALLSRKADIVDGKIPVTQLPNYVDDVLDGMYANGNFYPAIFNPSNPDFIPDVRPYTPESGKLYIDTRYNKAYRWEGSQYVEVAGGSGGGSMDAYTKSETDTLLAAKQDNINDLNTIRGGAAAGATAYQKPSAGIPASDLATAVQTSLGKADTALQSFTETDPTVPAWAKAESKPTYAYSEITGTPSLAAVATSGDYDDLTNKPTIPDVSGKQDKRTLEDNSSASGAVTIYPDKYHDLGVTDSANVVYPTRAGVVDGYSIEVTGVSSDVVDFMDRLAVYVSDAEDTAAVSALLAAQAANSGATASYTMSKSAWSGFFSACNEIDEVGEDTYPEADLQTSEDVDVPHQVPDFARADEFLFTFTCSTDNCALTLPAGVSYGNGLDFDADKKASRKFQFSISDDIALYAYIDPSNS